MKKEVYGYRFGRWAPIVLSMLLSTVALLGLLTQVTAETEQQKLIVEKSILHNDGILGGGVQYQIVISNTGMQSATVLLTDSLPANTTLVSDSILTACDFDLYATNDLLTSADYVLQPGHSVMATYTVTLGINLPMNRLTKDSIVSFITNTVFIEEVSSGQIVSDVVVATVMTNSIKSHLPLVTAPGTISGTDAVFTDLRQPQLQSDQLKEVASAYYYEENFSTPCNPADWHIVRQDTDSVINEVTIRELSPGYIDMRMESRFDYMIVSDLTHIPTPNYRITARMRLEDADPLHTGGIIFGGDYDGTSPCPVSATDYSSCFNQYYRLSVIAGNVPNQMLVTLHRITDHAESDNTASGTSLGTASLEIDDATRDSWIEWGVEFTTDGAGGVGVITIKRGEDVVMVVNEENALTGSYFGLYSATSEFSFSNTHVDWIKVESIE